MHLRRGSDERVHPRPRTTDGSGHTSLGTHDLSRWSSVTLCGQVAADPDAIQLRMGLQVRELSIPPAGVPLLQRALAPMMPSQIDQQAMEGS